MRASDVPGSDGRSFAQDCDPYPLETPDFRAQAYHKYSRELLDLIERTVAYEQADRPTFQELLDTIRRHTGGQPGVVNRANGMRQKRAGAPEWISGQDSVWPFLSKDKYALLAKVPGLPVPPNLDSQAWRTPPFRKDLVKADDDNAEVGGGPWRGVRKQNR